jgi:uncharacterized protein involved in exopolysaccharide biosynthesis
MSNHLLADNIGQQFFNILRRHQKKVLAFPTLCVVVGTAVILWWPRTYESEARLFLRMGRESVGLDPTVNTGQALSTPPTAQKDEVKSAIEVLKSPSIASAVVDRLGVDVVLGRDAASQQKTTVFDILAMPLKTLKRVVRRLDPISDQEFAIDHVRRNLDAEAERESTVIVVTYSAKTPQLAKTVCAEIINAYRDEHMRIHRAEESSPFFDEQHKRLSEKLDEALGALAAAKNERGLASVEQRQATLEAELQVVEMDRLRTEQEMATAQAQIENLEQQLANLPERVIASKRSVPNLGADSLREQLYVLQLKAMDLQARYSDSHPLVKAMKTQEKEAKQVLAQQADQRIETTDDLNEVHRQLSLDLKRAQSTVAGCLARQAESGKQREAVLADLRGVNGSQVQIDRLTQQVQLTRDNYLQYARNLEQARIDKELENEKISSISILQPAMLIERPAVPSKKLVAAGTILLAIAGTTGLVICMEKLGTPMPPERTDDVPRQRTLRRVRRRIASKTNIAVGSAMPEWSNAER